MRPVLSPHRLAPALLAGVALCACGEPGVATPMPEPPAIDVGGVTGREYAATAGDNGAEASVTFETGPGATTAGARVRATNLDGTAPVSNSFARADGSFSVTALAARGDTLRLQAVLDGVRGPPVDIVYMGANSFSAVTRPDCLDLAPGLWLTFEDGEPTQDVTLSSTCTGAVSVENPRARLSLADFALETSLPVTLDPGGEATLRVRFEPTSAGEREDVLFFDAIGADAEVIRYPVTVFGEGP